MEDGAGAARHRVFLPPTIEGLQPTICRVQQLYEDEPVRPSVSVYGASSTLVGKRLDHLWASHLLKPSSARSSHAVISSNSSVHRHVPKPKQSHRTASASKTSACSSPVSVVGRKLPFNQPVASVSSLTQRLRSDDGDRARTHATSSRSSTSARGRLSSNSSAVRLCGEDAAKKYSDRLTDWEMTEIVDYRAVYYLGSTTAKKAAQAEGVKNNGFDDADGFYICKPRDHLVYRYELQDLLGKGTFGQVVRAVDHKTHSVVAIKIVKNERPFLRQAREEIRILEALRKQDKNDNHNLVHILDSFNFRGHMCITFELLGITLHQVLKRTRGQGFGLNKVQKMARALLRCLEVLHRNNIVHCDLKPENILLRRPLTSTGNCPVDLSIKVIDFGSSCYEQQQIYTYIQSRYYRAPEVIVGVRYGCPIDMWSLACVLGELITTKPLFAGENEFDQLASIMEVRGVPPRSLLDRGKRTDKFFNSHGQPRYCTKTPTSDKPRTRGPPLSVHLSSLLKNCEDAVFLDFMRRALSWDPCTRLTAPDALQHPWVTRNTSHHTRSGMVGDVLRPSKSKDRTIRLTPAKHGARPGISDHAADTDIAASLPPPTKTQSRTRHHQERSVLTGV